MFRQGTDLTFCPGIVDGDIEPPKEEVGGPAVPPPQDLPQRLSLDDALKIFRARGFGLLIADANIASARGDEKIAGAVPNPALNIGYGRVLGSGVSCAGGDCLDQYTIGISDRPASRTACPASETCG